MTTEAVINMHQQRTFIYLYPTDIQLVNSLMYPLCNYSHLKFHFREITSYCQANMSCNPYGNYDLPAAYGPSCLPQKGIALLQRVFVHGHNRMLKQKYCCGVYRFHLPCLRALRRPYAGQINFDRNANSIKRTISKSVRLISIFCKVE